jgi:phosphoribosylanthranilate isomerase
MWIKICGMTSEEAVAAALEQSVDAIGFVFAASVRRLEPQRAAQLAAPARGRVRCVAVTLHPQQGLIDQILSVFKPDVLQTDLEDIAALRLPSSLALLPVVRATAGAAAMAGAAATAAAAAPAALPPRLLFEGPHSGSGTAPDWAQAARLAAASELILAGGLNADNVAAAIAAVRPFGVDTSSGVELAPGRKSPQKIVAFVQAARAAFRDGHEPNRNRS